MLREKREIFEILALKKKADSLCTAGGIEREFSFFLPFFSPFPVKSPKLTARANSEEIFDCRLLRKLWIDFPKVKTCRSKDEE